VTGDLRTCRGGVFLRRLVGLAAGLGLAGLATTAWGQCNNYTVTTGAGAIVPGTTDIGNHIDDGLTLITLPFTFSLYGTAYTTAQACSNGNLQFGTLSGSYTAAYTNECLTLPPAQITDVMIAPYWDDQRTDVGTGSGIYTSVSGSPGSRIFNIEWRAVYYNNNTQIANYEVRLYENSARFDIVYGQIDQGGSSATVGVQRGGGSGIYNQFECNTGGLSSGMMLTFTCPASFPPSCVLSTSASAGPAGGSFVAMATVVPGSGSPNGITSVSLDATQVNGGTVALHDDGIAPDVTAGDGIYSGNVTVGAATPNGVYTLTSTVTDQQNRSSTCTHNYTVSAANDDCGGAIPAVLGDNSFDNSSATTSTPAAACGLLGSDLWYSFSDPTGGQVTVSTCGSTADTAIAAYDGCNGPSLACNDDSQCGGVFTAQSNISFCAAPNHTYMLRIGGFNGAFWVGTFNVSIAAGSPPTVAGSANPTCATPGGSVTLMAQVTSSGCPAQTVTSATADASSVGGSASVTLHDDGLPPDVAANDGIFSGSTTVAGSTTPGSYTMPMTVNFSGGPQSTSATVTVGNPYTAPANCHSENESCGLNFPDSVDGGCNSTPYIYNAAQLCETYCGSGANSTAYRDTDWWTFYLPQADTITVTGQAAFRAQWFILASTCPAIILSPVANNTCGADLSLTYATGPGTYVFFCSPAGFDGSAVCGTNDSYWFRINTASGQGCDWPVGIGQATPNTVSNCGDQNTLLTVHVTPGTNPASTGITVSGDLTSIGGSPTQTFYDDGTHGDAVAGDGTYSFQTLISYTTTTGIKSIPFTINDAQGRTFPATLGVNVTACTQLGACCTDAGCSLVSGPNCAGQNGNFHGVGTSCGTDTYAFSTSQGQFVDISNTGTLEPITTGCDDCTTDIVMPFNFTFFGNTYTDINICSNGNLQFGTTPAANFINDNPPTAAAPNNAIYPCWDDLYTTTGGIYYQTDGASPNRTFTIAWINRTQYLTGPPETFEAILYETSNNIEFRYGTMPADAGGEGGPGGSDYTIGVENADGTVAYTILGADIGTGNTARMLTRTAGVNPCTPNFCCLNDFNGDGDVGTDLDIEDFFRCLAGNCCATCPPNADFNCDGDVGTDGDIEAFFRVLAGGPC
jgi:hypothetical protein